MTRIRVGTFNIRHGALADQRARTRTTAAAARELSADVLALQEVDQRVARSYFVDQARMIARRSGYRTTLFAPARRLMAGWYGNAMLTHLDTSDVEVLALPVNPGREARCAIYGTVDVDGVAVRVVSAHLQHQRANEPAPDEAIRQLDLMLSLLRSHPGPAIALGDWNLTPKWVNPILKRHGLTGADSAPTFTVNNPRKRIDWVAYRGCDLLHVEVPNLRASDHFPLIADLNVPAGPALSAR